MTNSLLDIQAPQSLQNLCDMKILSCAKMITYFE